MLVKSSVNRDIDLRARKKAVSELRYTFSPARSKNITRYTHTLLLRSLFLRQSIAPSYLFLYGRKTGQFKDKRPARVVKCIQSDTSRSRNGISGRTNENNVRKDRDPYFIPGIAFVNVGGINFFSFVVVLSVQCEKKRGKRRTLFVLSREPCLRDKSD